MGSVTPYQTASGRRYRAIYRKPDHAQTQKRGFTTKRNAEQFFANVEVDKSGGVYVETACFWGVARLLDGRPLRLKTEFARTGAENCGAPHHTAVRRLSARRR
jgi:hypothetical protein